MSKAKPTTETVVTPAVEGITEETPPVEETIKQGFKKIKVKDFRGSFGNAFFNDDGEAEISESDLEVLSKHFPDAEIEEIA